MWQIFNFCCIKQIMIILIEHLVLLMHIDDRPCGLVFSVPNYIPRGPGFDSRRYQIFWVVVGLEQGPLILVSINEGLCERKCSSSSLENRH
jgi:hypothetical protein